MKAGDIVVTNSFIDDYEINKSHHLYFNELTMREFVGAKGQISYIGKVNGASEEYACVHTWNWPAESLTLTTF